MTKTICDICGKEMENNKVGDIHELNFCISSYGKIWDICNNCREEINLWINRHKHKMEHESNGPCDLCRFNPPGSGDGKPCTMCPAEGR